MSLPNSTSPTDPDSYEAAYDRMRKLTKDLEKHERRILTLDTIHRAGKISLDRLKDEMWDLHNRFQRSKASYNIDDFMCLGQDKVQQQLNASLEELREKPSKSAAAKVKETCEQLISINTMSTLGFSRAHIRTFFPQATSAEIRGFAFKLWRNEVEIVRLYQAAFNVMGCEGCV